MASSGKGAPAIGIDLGTTFSCVAVWKNGRVKIISNDQGNRTTPSFVAFTDAERLVGDVAKNQVAKNPTNTVYNAKRLIGRSFSDVTVQEDIKLLPFKVIEGPSDMPNIVVTHKGNEQQFSTEEISSMILAKMKEVAEAYTGNAVNNAVITVPAYFNDRQRQATKDAAAIAGLNVMRLINEPTAAAIAYGIDNMLGLTGKRNVLVFDLGGGTFDVSLLTINEVGMFEVKAAAGNSHLGGEDFDNCMVDHCVEDFKKKWKKDLIGKRRALGRLKARCEKAKRILSSATHASIDLDSLLDDIDFSMEISRATFDELNMSLFTKCIKQVETCLADAKMTEGSVNEVILVGGSTRIPKIQRMLQEFFDGKDLCKEINPDEAVAYGAAVMAAKLSGETTNFVKELKVFDITPLSLGVQKNGDIMSVVIPRNTHIPSKKSRSYVTTKDDQSSAAILVYQGERSKSSDNYLLGSFMVSGIPPVPKRVSVIEICFEIDDNGILTVTAKVVSTGKTEKLSVTNVSGRLSNHEIEKMVKDAEKFKLEDQEYKRKAKAYNDLEDCMYHLKKKIRSDYMPLMDLKDMNCAINDILKWLSGSKAADVAEIERKKKHLESIVGRAVSG